MRELPSARAEMELPSALSAQLYPCETPKRGGRIAQHLGPREATVRDEGADHATRGAGRLRVFSRLTEVGIGAADPLVLVVPMQRCVACGGQELLVSRGRAATCDSLRGGRSSARARHVTRQHEAVCDPYDIMFLNSCGCDCVLQRRISRARSHDRCTAVRIAVRPEARTPASHSKI